MVLLGDVRLKGPVLLAHLGAIPLVSLALHSSQRSQDAVGDGQHHGRGGGVVDPHGQEGRDEHEAQQQAGGKEREENGFCTPTRNRTLRAVLLWRFQRCPVIATIRLPMNLMLESLMYWTQT